MLCASLLCCLLLAAPADGVVWEEDFLEAFEKAAELDRPVLICINMDNEWANDTLAKKLYHNPEFVELSQSFVCLAASIFDHPSADDPKMCARFPGITCGQHKLIESQTRQTFIKGREVVAPQHIVASKDRELLSRQAYYDGKDVLFRFLKGVLGKGSGPEAAEDEYDPNEPIRLPIKKLADLRERATTTDWGELYRLLDEIDSLQRPIAAALYSEFAQNEELPEKVRVGAIERLGVKGSYDAIDLLVSLLSGKDTSLQLAAVKSLEVAELPDATEELLNLLRRRPAETLECSILRSLGACGAGNEQAFKALERGLRDSNALVRCSSALGLGYVVAGLGSADSAEENPDRAKAIKKLIAALRDRQSQVRGTAVYALGLARAAEAKQALEKLAANDDDRNVRNCAAAALANLDQEGLVPPELRRFRWKFTGDITR